MKREYYFVYELDSSDEVQQEISSYQIKNNWEVIYMKILSINYTLEGKFFSLPYKNRRNISKYNSKGRNRRNKKIGIIYYIGTSTSERIRFITAVVVRPSSSASGFKAKR